MTPMCDSTTGEQLGWAIAVASCEGDITLTYYDVDGAVEGGTLPVGWRPCVQGEPGPEWSATHTDTAYASTVNIDFADAEYVSIDDVTGNLELTGSNYSAPKHIVVRIKETGGSSRTLTFVTAWVFVGPKPTSIAANKTGILTLIAFGPTAADVVANWEVQT